MEDIVKLYVEEGKSIYEIADIIDLSPVGVWKKLKRLGVQTRKNGNSGKKWRKNEGVEEYLGGDGRYWVRNYRPERRKTAERRYIVIMEKKLGGPIPRGFVVHHIDGDELNDHPDNLELISSADHSRKHQMGVKNPGKAVKKFLLNPEQIDELVKLYNSGVPQNKLAAQFKIHQTTVSNYIRKRKLEGVDNV